MTNSGVVTPVRIPADVEREDRVLANLTARQLALLTVPGVALYGAFMATRTVVPPLVFAIVAAPVAIVAVVVVLGSRDGVSLDRLLLAALRQRLSPRVQVAAPAGVPDAPSWVVANATTTQAKATSPSGALRFPAEGVCDTTAGVGVGVVDLGADGVAAVCVCSTVNFALRTPEEQEALVATFGRYLHSLSAPVQYVIRAQRLDLSGQIVELREHAGALPHPALEQAALEHADYLAQLDRQSVLLRRQVLLILRESLRPAGALTPFTIGPLALLGRSLLGRSRRAEIKANQAARHAAEARLARRIGEAVGLLSAAGIVLTPLDVAQADAVLAGACNPDRLIPPTAPLAAPDDIITTGYAEDTDTLAGFSGWTHAAAVSTATDGALAVGDGWDGVEGNELFPPASPTSGGVWWDR